MKWLRNQNGIESYSGEKQIDVIITLQETDEKLRVYAQSVTEVIKLIVKAHQDGLYL